MLDPGDPMVDLLERDKRYKFEAYQFVFEALDYGQTRLDMGSAFVSPDTAEYQEIGYEEEELSEGHAERHVTGQELCEAIRQFALEQYGMMARTVLAEWGIQSTSDCGEIVFNLIDIKKMKKTEQDRREDFDEVFDFGEAFKHQFVFTPQHPHRGA